MGNKAEARHQLEEKIRELGEGVLIVMGSHGRRGIRRLIRGSKTEEVVRDYLDPVLLIKAPSAKASPTLPGPRQPRMHERE